VLNQEPTITFTANHVLVAYQCEKAVKSAPKPNAKPKAKSKKVAVAKE
jgi:hypothetical protein